MKQVITPSQSINACVDAEVKKLESLLDAKLDLNDPAIIEQSQKIDALMDRLFAAKAG